ncbi:uncharacterized protein FIESC28_05547 [Fusarium coffeatum]|uniref:NYN domain-containing protein n=1 Tax=Fusarium coffeatum TaxID=231269 RepID=A0A366RRT2_9HYPO|nr:uncharacterized protein FIESC28_05547 [Fusarium coffeatum]RBR19552.1 hypothetical protein FIESC28_05547 [Fusarium coffeatum]
MSTTSESSVSSESIYTTPEGFRFAYVYVDESNLSIQGGKEWAKRHPESPNHHPNWQYDLSVLVDRIEDGLGFNEDDDNQIYFRLYGSDIQPLKKGFRARSRHVFEVMEFQRSKFDGREKQVDTSLVVDMVHRATSYMHLGFKCTFAFVSGDADMIPAAVTASECGFNVHIWSWKNSLSNTFREIWNTEEGKGATEGLISLHYLDDHLNDITMGFSEKSSESTVPVVQRCRWREYCNKRDRCNRHHTDEEKNFFSSGKAQNEVQSRGWFSHAVPIREIEDEVYERRWLRTALKIGGKTD